MVDDQEIRHVDRGTGLAQILFGAGFAVVHAWYGVTEALEGDYVAAFSVYRLACVLAGVWLARRGVRNVRANV